MTEITIVRENLMTVLNYTPYCGAILPTKGSYEQKTCSTPRTIFNGDQFYCPSCGWVSKFPKEFIDRYKLKWNKLKK